VLQRIASGLRVYPYLWRWRTAAPLYAGLLLSTVLACATAQHPPYPQGIESEKPDERIRQIKMAGDRRDESVVPLLVDRLEDEDEGVRLVAILALERITGTRRGYDYAKPPAERARAVQRWRCYLDARAAASQPSGDDKPLVIP
jgi:hypothetical protein